MWFAAKKFEKWLEKLQVDANVDVEQETTLLGTVRILMKVLEQQEKGVTYWALGHLLWPAQ